MSQHCMLTYTGKLFDPLEATLDDIDIRDIAHHLSLVNRYGGATRVGYSVAEHSLAVSSIAQSKWGISSAKLGLLHDASEAYIGDVCRGLKYRPGIMESYRDAEETLMAKILKKYRIDTYSEETHARVKKIDRQICADEMRQLMTQALDVNGEPLTATYGVVVGLMRPAEAESRFLARYYELWGVE